MIKYLIFISLLAIALSVAAPNHKCPENRNSEVIPQNITTECGGIVYVTRSNNPSIVYKQDVNYNNNEHCVWTIVPEPGLALDGFIFIVEDHNFAEGDGLTIFSWEDNDRLAISARTIEWDEIAVAISIPTTQHAFLYFSSDDEYEGSGFKIDVIGLHGDGMRNDKVYHFESVKSCFDSFSFDYPKYPATTYNNGEQVSIVLQPDYGIESTDFDIAYLDTEVNYDVLIVYHLTPYNESDSFILEGLYDGLHPEGFNLDSSSTPRLILFTSDTSQTRRGFSFNWYI